MFFFFSLGSLNIFITDILKFLFHALAILHFSGTKVVGVWCSGGSILSQMLMDTFLWVWIDCGDSRYWYLVWCLLGGCSIPWCLLSSLDLRMVNISVVAIGFLVGKTPQSLPGIAIMQLLKRRIYNNNVRIISYL